jgi:hypothetical protein
MKSTHFLARSRHAKLAQDLASRILSRWQSPNPIPLGAPISTSFPRVLGEDLAS